MRHIATITWGTILIAGFGCSTSGGDATTLQAERQQLEGDTLYVAGVGALASYDVLTGAERPGEVQSVVSPVDLQALDDGTLLVDMTDMNQVLIVDGTSMLETARLPSSSLGALRPVHTFISPTLDARRFFVSTNDGNSGDVTTDSAHFIDVMPGSPRWLQPVGEVPLGIGHHKAAFSATRPRLLASNIADCDNVLSVYDFTDLTDIRPLLTISAAEVGWDGTSYATTCDASYANGQPPAPHGSATSKVSNEVYSNLTSSGGIVVVDIDSDPPSFRLLATHGSGGGYTKAGMDGHYVYSLQESPRESDQNRPGAPCQIGQLVVLDAQTDTVASELPLRYRGPDCSASLAGTDEETARPSHMRITPDGKTLFVQTAGGFGVESARSRQELVVDLADPAHPVQLPSIAVGTSTGDHGDAISHDGHFLFVTNTEDATVSKIDTRSLTVVATIATINNPLSVTTCGADGPGEQTGPIH